MPTITGEFIQFYLVFVENLILTIKEIPLGLIVAAMVFPGNYSALMCCMALRAGTPFLKPIDSKLLLDAVLLRKTSFFEKSVFIATAPISLLLYLFLVVLIVIFFFSYNGGIEALERIKNLIRRD